MHLSVPYVQVNGVTVNKNDYTVKYYEDADRKQELTTRSKLTLSDTETAKTITVVITGKGNFQAKEITTTYQVVKPAGKIDLSGAKIVAKEKSRGKDVKVSKQAYNGNPVEPEIRVLYKDGRDWKEAKADSYEVEYFNNVNRGTAMILVRGKGETAVGSRTEKFTIVQKDMSSFGESAK